MHDKKRPVEGEHLSTGRWFLSFKPHGIASQHLLTGNLSGVLRGKRRSGIDGLLRGRVCGQRFANAYAVRAAGSKAPLERTVAEFLFHRDRLGRAQFLCGMKEKAACVVLFCWAAALDPDAGKADIQKIREKVRGFPVLLKGHVIPEGNIESASNAVFSAAVLNSTYPVFPSRISALMRSTGRSEENPSGRSARSRSCSTP